MIVVVVLLAGLVVMLGLLVARQAETARRLGEHLERERRERAAVDERLRALERSMARAAEAVPEPVAAREVPQIATFDEPDLEWVTTSRVLGATFAEPLIKVAAVTHGLRRALDDDSRMRIRHGMRKELKHQQKQRRRRRAARAADGERRLAAMSRISWFAAGAAAGVYGFVKARRTVESFTPDGVGARLAALGTGVRLFTDEVRTQTSEREDELKQRLEARRATGPLIEGHTGEPPK